LQPSNFVFHKRLTVQVFSRAVDLGDFPGRP
jgi:hypothetical protein